MFLRMVMASILRRRSRVLVAMAAVAIGATTLSALATIAVDVPRQMAREMRSYGANMVVLPNGEGKTLDTKVVPEVSKQIPSGSLVGAVGYEYQPITINDLPYVSVGADLAAVRKLSPFWYVDGAWPKREGSVLLGKQIANATDAKVGSQIELTRLVEKQNSASPVQKDGQIDYSQSAPGAGAKTQKLTVKVAGIVETGGPEDGFVYMFPPDMQKLTGHPFALTVAEFSVAASSDTLQSLANSISKNDSYTATPVARLAHSDASVLDMLRSLMAIITVIVLALIMIGVSTTMMAVVTERRNEIGLRKALGAEDRSIVTEFLGEGVVLGLVGGVVGAGLGFGLAQVISLNVFHRTVALHFSVIAATIVVAVLVSTLASAIPVRRAVEVDPALVLRGE
ncbi:cell division protein FtsX [Actinomyces sp. HMSC06A08]|nr:efflux ABC transporter, permease protein [Winkia neuii]OFJ70587.1 cell division protein FtsX [Actinomyces sp. HMSC064C12]OFT54136.1 cell division protein FtsX [Actinomyces sp. HMSC06A08]